MAKNPMAGKRSFGPAIVRATGEPPRAVCTYCCFRSYHDRPVCTESKETRTIPFDMETPDWCRFKADMLAETSLARP